MRLTVLQTIPDFDLVPGTVLCLHIPHGASEMRDDVQHQLRQQAERQAGNVIVARPARPRDGFREFLHHQSSVEWLSAAAGISNDKSAAIIRGFGIGVRPVMSHNAGDPRAFLGAAVALAQKPDVLIYETAGMSPQGQWLLHEYVAERASELCAVHISHPTRYGTGRPAPRTCPQTARCVELDGNL